jgi:hypothetical protein
MRGAEYGLEKTKVEEIVPGKNNGWSKRGGREGEEEEEWNILANTNMSEV